MIYCFGDIIGFKVVYQVCNLGDTVTRARKIYHFFLGPLYMRPPGGAKRVTGSSISRQ